MEFLHRTNGMTQNILIYHHLRQYLRGRNKPRTENAENVALAIDLQSPTALRDNVEFSY